MEIGLIVGLVITVGLFIGLYVAFKESNDSVKLPSQRKDILDPLDNSLLGTDVERVTIQGVKSKTFVMRVNRRNATKLRSRGFSAFPRFHKNLRSGGHYDFYAGDAFDDLMDLLYVIELFEDWDDESYPEFAIGEETFDAGFGTPDVAETSVDPSVANLVADKSVEELTGDMQVEAPDPVVEVEAPDPVVEVEAPATPVVETVPEPDVAPEPAPYVAPEPAPYVAPEPAYEAPSPSYESPSYDSGGSSYDGGSSSSCGGGDF